MASVEANCQVVNAKGMHARAAARLVAEVARFNATATLSHLDRSAPGNSLIKLLTLNAPQGSIIRIRCEGEQAQAMLNSLQSLFAEGFGE